MDVWLGPSWAKPKQPVFEDLELLVCVADTPIRDDHFDLVKQHVLKKGEWIMSDGAPVMVRGRWWVPLADGGYAAADTRHVVKAKDGQYVNERLVTVEINGKKTLTPIFQFETQPHKGSNDCVIEALGHLLVTCSSRVFRKNLVAARRNRARKRTFYESSQVMVPVSFVSLSRV